MWKLPILQPTQTSQQVMTTFAGYNANHKFTDGEFSDTLNLTASDYPMLSVRGKRTTSLHLNNASEVLAKEHLAYVVDGVLFYNEQNTEITGLTDISSLVSMGAYIIAFTASGGVWYNTADGTHGSLAQSNTVHASQTNISYNPCDSDGNYVNYKYIQVPTPTSPAKDEFWLHHEVGYANLENREYDLRQYNGETWIPISKTYVKISATGIGAGLKKGQVVTLTGLKGNEADYNRLRETYYSVKKLNGDHEVIACGDDYIVIEGVVVVISDTEPYVQTEGTATADRVLPDMDYVVECQNRLWGCKYGMVDGKMINEIYASALGDFLTWRQYKGLSTDSYTASVGTDGKWTGAISYNNNPIFFKENCLHKVFISAVGAHQIKDMPCDGVQEGCGRSLAIVDNVLLYKSRKGVMAYDGTTPIFVSKQLGEKKYTEAIAGAIDGIYYMSAKDSDGSSVLFTYDLSKNIWHRETPIAANGFARLGDSLYVATPNGIVDLTGGTTDIGASVDPAIVEGDVEWIWETGMMGIEIGHKYISRINIRMLLPKDSECDLYIQYDSSGKWEHKLHIKGKGLKTFLAPIIPRRCDHLKLKMIGKGEMRMYSLAKVYEQGSDVNDA